MSSLNDKNTKKFHPQKKEFKLKRCNYESFEWLRAQSSASERDEQSDSDYIPEEESDDSGIYTDAEIDELLSESETLSSCPHCFDRNLN